MKLAWLELRRRPGRFAIVGSALTVLVLLMLFLGKLLDGLFLGSTGAIRIHEADFYVYSADARESLLRSSITDGELDGATDLDASGFGVTLLGIAIPGVDDTANGSIGGYESAGGGLPAPPPTGEGLADESLKDLGAAIGDTVLVGPAQTPVTIVGWVDDSNYLLQNSLWVNGETWRSVQNQNRPDAPIADDEWQIGLVRWPEFRSDTPNVDEVRQTFGGVALNEKDATFAIPGVPEQQSTLSAVIWTTAFVIVVIVALFFALLTLERTGLYAVLKANGASNSMLISGLILQAVVVAVVAYAIGGLLSWLLGLVVPPEVPVQYTTSRSLFVLVAVVIAAVLGGLMSFRKILKIEPAAAIGAGL